MKAELGSDKSSNVRKVVLEVLKDFNKKGIVISDSTSFVGDLEFDSLLVMEFISELEDQLDVSVPINILPDIETVGILIVNAKRIVREEHG
ncbi:MAG: hypothetical protein CBC47_05980 [Alphaproteobacteria bacterium TMED87]|nr:phosphopantetheine-binding protein [Rhodospirillaceae bacterium]OUV09188.1 MAG: hypothetical protein CBC47_05980 [Alphaproteobacteria bacterium TMED87]|tara:strand:+ start:690 stop:962 length:273 start_codon:yes stop_codon:yes gene_type:complete